jgi:poly-gamma-glutamate synthesis protein (capsule biosynthesis protein)
MSSGPFAVAAVGDAMLLHPIAASMTDPASAAVLEILRTADVAVGNCEVSGFDERLPAAIPQAESGGLWLNAGPQSLEDLRACGFTMMSRANNHAFDFGAGGMAETDRLLTRHRIAHAGTGATLAAARAPAYQTTRAGRIALVSATDTAPSLAMAGDARRDMVGRPGVNLIRAASERGVDARTFEALVAALDVAREQGCDLGEMVDDGRTILGLGTPIHKGEQAESLFVLNERDVEDNLDQLRVARARADLVLFALHTHLPHSGVDVPPSIRDLAHRAIDSGADMVIGHGPHIVRGIEIHRGKPIFYSLGNFVCHLPKVGFQPSDLYDKFTRNPGQATFTRQLGSGKELRDRLDDAGKWESVMARVIDDGERRFVELHPIDLQRDACGVRLGTPRLADAPAGKRIIEELAELSAPFETEIAIADGIGRIELTAFR